jgi:hypothetical protein
MPIWLRNFTYKKIEEFYKKQEQAQNKQSNKLKNDSKVHRPDINPSNVYNTSAPRKK